MKITVRREITIEFHGSEEEYVQLADGISRLDSLDAGDATGLFANLCCAQQDGALSIMAPSGQMLSAIYDDDLFEYEGEWGS